MSDGFGTASEQSGAQPSAEAADPLAGDWAEGLPGPARALGLPEPMRLSLDLGALPRTTESSSGDAALAAPDPSLVAARPHSTVGGAPLEIGPAIPAPQEAPALIEASGEWAGMLDPPLRGELLDPPLRAELLPPSPEPEPVHVLPSVIVDMTTPSDPAIAPAPDPFFAALSSGESEPVPEPAADAPPEGAATVRMFPALHPPSPGKLEELPPKAASSAVGAAPSPSAPAPVSPLARVPTPTSEAERAVAEPLAPAPTPWSEVVIEDAELPAEWPAPAVQDSAASSLPRDSGWTRAPANDVPPEPSRATSPVWDMAAPASEAVPAAAIPAAAVPADAISAAAVPADPVPADTVPADPVPAQDVIWSSPPPTGEQAEDWVIPPSSPPQIAPDPSAVMPAPADGAFATLGDSPDWVAPAAATAADEAWAPPPAAAPEMDWNAAPAASVAVEDWSAPSPAPPAVDDAWASPQVPGPAPGSNGAAWNSPAVGASALEQLEGGTMEAEPGAAQQLFGSVGGPLSGDNDDLGPPEELESPEQFLRPVELASPEEFLKPIDRDDKDLPVAVPTAPKMALAQMRPKSYGALEVAGEHRVAVHLRGGGTRRGTLRDADLSKSSFSLLPQGGGAAEPVYHAEVKAIFFMLSPGEKPKPPDGSKVVVTFADGRTIEGLRDGADAKHGFFLVPSDAAHTKTRRIYIAREATSHIEEG